MNKSNLTTLGLGILLVTTFNTMKPEQSLVQKTWKGIKRIGAGAAVACLAVAELEALKNDKNYLFNRAEHYPYYRRLGDFAWDTASGLGYQISGHAVRIWLIKKLGNYAYYGEFKRNNA